MSRLTSSGKISLGDLRGEYGTGSGTRKISEFNKLSSGGHDAQKSQVSLPGGVINAQIPTTMTTDSKVSLSDYYSTADVDAVSISTSYTPSPTGYSTVQYTDQTSHYSPSTSSTPTTTGDLAVSQIFGVSGGSSGNFSSRDIGTINEQTAVKTIQATVQTQRTVQQQSSQQHYINSHTNDETCVTSLANMHTPSGFGTSDSIYQAGHGYYHCHAPGGPCGSPNNYSCDFRQAVQWGDTQWQRPNGYGAQLLNSPAAHEHHPQHTTRAVYQGTHSESIPTTEHVQIQATPS